MTPSAAKTRAPDPRPARTRAAITDAVDRLCRDGEEVTVSAILRVAGVSRSAFYAQFSDIESVALAMLTDAFHRIGERDGIERAMGSDGARAITTRALAALASYITQRRAFFAASLEWKVSARVREAVVAAFAREVHKVLERFDRRDLPDAEADDLARFAAGGTLDVLVASLRAGDDESRMTERLLAVQPEWLVPRA